MRLEALYRARFSTPGRWSVRLDSAHGTESQSLLFAQGRCEGQVTGSLRAANFPRLRSAGRSLINISSVTKLRLPLDVLFLGTRSARPVRRQAVSSRRSAPWPCTYSD